MYWTDPEHWKVNPEDLVLIARALALRKLRRIGVLWIDEDRIWVSENEYDPYGSRVRVSMATLRAMVERGEATVRKPTAREETRLLAKKAVAD